MTDWTPLFVALIAALPGLYALFSQSRKDNAEAVDAISQAAAQLVIPLKQENKELRDRLVTLEAKYTAATAENEELRERLAAVEAENKELATENEQLQQQFDELREILHMVLEGCNRLCAQLERLGHEPVFDPAAWLDGEEPSGPADDLISWDDDPLPGGET